MHPLALTLLISSVSFCSNWNKGKSQDKLDFLLGPEPKILSDLKTKGMHDKQIEIFKVCFEVHILKLRDRLDQDCRTEAEMTTFFGVPIDTSSQEYDDMTDYINMCATAEGRAL